MYLETLEGFDEKRTGLVQKLKRLNGMGGKTVKKGRKEIKLALESLAHEEIQLLNDAASLDITSEKEMRGIDDKPRITSLDDIDWASLEALLEQAEPGTVIKTLRGIKVTKGDKDDWLFLRSPFVLNHAQILDNGVPKDMLAKTYKEAVELILNPKPHDNYAALEETYMSDPEFSPVIDPKKAERGKVLKSFPDGIEIVKYDPNYWTDFSVRCPRRKNPIPGDTYSEALRTVRQIQEIGDGFMKWDLKDEFKK